MVKNVKVKGHKRSKPDGDGKGYKTVSVKPYKRSKPD